MAIIHGVPGVKVTVQVNERDADEYLDCRPFRFGSWVITHSPVISKHMEWQMMMNSLSW